MAVTVTPYLEGVKRLINGGIDLDTHTMKLALALAAYTPNTDTHAFFSDVTNEVAAGDGYTAGGATLASIAITVDTTNNRVDTDAADVTWVTTGGLSSRYGIIYRDTGSAATSPLLLLIDFGATTLVDGVIFNAAGFLRIAA